MRAIPVLLLLALSAIPAAADELERVPPISHAATQKECGECHMAFQPALLPARSWSKVMDGLADHFGEDASLAPELVAEIRAYLTGNAGAGNPSHVRITEQPWWLKEHRFRPSVWQRKEVGSKANCEACHRAAAQGLYEDD